MIIFRQNSGYDRVFKSKVGWWYHLILLVMATSTVAAFVGGKSPVTMIVLLLFTLECIHMLLSTWYKITADGYLIACFDKDVTEETVKAIAQKQPVYAVFRDSSMASDSVATNFEQIFETYSPRTQRKVL